MALMCLSASMWRATRQPLPPESRSSTAMPFRVPTQSSSEREGDEYIVVPPWDSAMVMAVPP